MVRLHRALRNVFFGTGLALMLTAGGFYLLTRTQMGYEIVLERGLEYLRGRIEGNVHVGGVSSPSLLGAVTLRDVSIEDARGDPFLVADSIQARYSLWGLVRGQTVFSSLQLWRPRVTIQKLPGDSLLNVVRIFTSPSAAADTTAVPPPDTVDGRILLRRVRVYEGRLDIVLAMGDPPGASPLRIEEAPHGGHVQRLTFREISGELPSASIREPGREGERIRVERLSLVGEVLDEPFVVSDFRGSVERRGSEVEVQAERLWLPGTETSGEARVAWGNPEGVEIALDVFADVMRLEDFRWIEPRLPDGGGRLGLVAELGPEGALWRLEQADVRVGESRIQGTAGIRPSPDLRLTQVDLLLNPLELSLLDPWLPDSIPIPGAVTGRVQMDGSLRSLRVDASLSHRLPGEDIPSTTGRLTGSLRLTEPLGAENGELLLSPFDFRIAPLLVPRLAFDGTGVVTLRADGQLDEGLRIDADIRHTPVGGAPSRVTSAGVVRSLDDRLLLDLNGSLEPLELASLSPLVGAVPVTGQVRGTYALAGPLSDLGIWGEVESSVGRLSTRGRFNARDPRSRYELEAEATDLELSRLLPDLPEPTVVSGAFSLAGSGLGRDSIRGTARVELRRSRVGHLDVDTAYTTFAAEGGLLDFDTAWASTSVGDLGAGGRMALSREAAASVEMHVSFSTDSLAGIRPFVLGDSLIAADTLSEIEREALVLGGVDPDTLPVVERVVVEGRVRADATVTGVIDSLSAVGTAEFADIVFGESFLRRGSLEFAIEGLPRTDQAVRARMVTDSVGVLNRRFESGVAAVDFARPIGDVRLGLVRGADEDLNVRASFELDSATVEVRLHEGRFRFDDSVWEMAHATDLTWSDRGIEVDDFLLQRMTTDPMAIRVAGVLPRDEGAADLRIDVGGLDLSNVARLVQLDRTVEGKMGLSLRVTGTAIEPFVTGDLAVADARYEGLAFRRIEGDLSYREGHVRTSLDAWSESDATDTVRVLTASAEIPAELSLRDLHAGFPREELDIRISADSLPAAAVLSFFDAFEDVQGTITGEVTIGGTVDELAPSGLVRLEGGRATVPALGIRPREVIATARLFPDGLVELEAEARSQGRALAQGTLRVDSLSNPAFDLNITARTFQAVDRRDVTGRVSGMAHLGGSYRRPFVTGNLSVDEGVLFIEEFARAAEVVDLSDPIFFDVVDTTLVSLRPILAASQNPFLNNLRVDMDLRVSRNAWIRSREMNVEMAGELGVLFDRTERDFVLVGELQAVRGTYTAWGRQFQVQEGTVGFVGTPGLDPVLNIEAVNRLRTSDGDPITIIASVEGTLIQPRVTLTSDNEPPLAESELISYLIFGRPSALLASGESAILQSAVGSGLTYGLGTLANQLGSVVAQEIGMFDYFAVTSTQQASLYEQGAIESTLFMTQIELGRYLTQDLFVAALIQPFSGRLDGGQRLPGFRVEWRFTDFWTWQAFAEDRFFRGAVGLGGAGLNQRILGFSIFREWGY